MLDTFACTRRLALALALAAVGLAAAVVPAEAAAAESRRGALVRVEVVENGQSKVETKAVWWNDTADVRVRIGGHEHALALTPSRRDRGFALVVDHARDGAMLADDVHVASEGRKVVLVHGDTRIVVMVVPTTMHVDVE